MWLKLEGLEQLFRHHFMCTKLPNSFQFINVETLVYFTNASLRKSGYTCTDSVVLLKSLRTVTHIMR